MSLGANVEPSTVSGVVRVHSIWHTCTVLPLATRGWGRMRTETPTCLLKGLSDTNICINYWYIHTLGKSSVTAWSILHYYYKICILAFQISGLSISVGPQPTIETTSIIQVFRLLNFKNDNDSCLLTLRPRAGFPDIYLDNLRCCPSRYNFHMLR